MGKKTEEVRIIEAKIDGMIERYKKVKDPKEAWVKYMCAYRYIKSCEPIIGQWLVYTWKDYLREEMWRKLRFTDKDMYYNAVTTDPMSF